ncbi:MAG: PepSY domain-containing protein [Erythrobacter sp.]
MMARFARWHIWLGWVVGVPIVGWLATGLFMVAKPIEEVRGNHLRIEQTAGPTDLPPINPAPISFQAGNTRPIESLETRMQRGTPVTFVRYRDGGTERFDARDGSFIAPLDENQARSIAAAEIIGGADAETVTLFASAEVPFDFRRPMPVWQVALRDGTHVYIGRATAQVEAVRTTWWRVFDFMWGLHIMDLRDRENTSHPILIIFTALALIGAVLGSILMFRRRRARTSVTQEGNV